MVPALPFMGKVTGVGADVHPSPSLGMRNISLQPWGVLQRWIASLEQKSLAQGHSSFQGQSEVSDRSKPGAKAWLCL